MERVQKDAHIFKVDVEKTKEYYKTISPCDCDVCCNFYQQIHGKYPQLEAFLGELGVDIARPEELVWYDNSWEDQRIDYTPYYTVTGSIEQWGRYEMDFDTNINVVVYQGEDPHIKVNSQQTEPYFVLEVFNVFLPWVLDAPFPAKPQRKTLWDKIKELLQRSLDAIKDKWPYVMLAMTILAVLVVGGFLLFTGIIGGSASEYHRELGQWYVENHGVYTEVGETIWKLVSVWEIVFWFFIPAYFVVACIYVNIKD